MKTKKILAFDDIKHLLPKNTSLYYVDYNDNLNNHTELIQKCIEEESAFPLSESVFDMYIDSPSYSFEELDKELASDIANEFGIEEDEAMEVVEEYEDYIRDHYYDVDDSTLEHDLLRNTSDINARVHMYSNYDCINSFWFEGGYKYEESYFGHMVDVLNLNPAKLKKLLVEKEVKCFGKFPNLKSRESKEYVSYESFYNELLNSTCGANLLTFAGNISLLDLYREDFKVTKIRLPKGINCGLFSSTYGGGSILEMELLRDMDIELDVPRNKNLTKFDSFGLLIDETNGYSIQEVYGMSSSFWNSKISIL